MTRAEEISQFLNTLRQGTNWSKKIYTRQQLEEMFKPFFKSTSGWWISALQRVGCIHSNVVHQRTKEYWFDEEPIGVKKHINPLLEELHKYNQNRNKPKISNLSEENCINYLKELGYKVMKPTRLSVTKLKAELGKDVFKFFEYEEL